MIAELLDGFDVTYFPAAGRMMRWPAQADPVQRALAVREAFGLWKGNKYDCYFQAGGEFDFSAAQLVYPGCKCAGMGREATLNKTSWFDWDAAKRIGFAFSNGTAIEDMAFSQASADPNVDGICCGFPAANLTATMRNVDVFGREWGLYNWAPDCNLTVEGFTITAGRVCVASENSGDGQNFTLRHGTIIGDASLSQCSANLDVSNTDNGGVFGIVHRGGLLKLSDVELQIKGLAAPPRACAITDRGGHSAQSGGGARVDLWNVRSTVTPSGADPRRCFDLDFSDPWIIASLETHGCRGSGWRGQLRTSF